MSLTGGFFNSKDHDRRYNAESISRLFDGIIEDGVYETYGDKFIVRQASGMDVKIGSGRAWFDHCWIHNDAKYRITIDSSEVVLDRIDTIVIDVDHSIPVRAVSFKVVRGIPASSPVAAKLVNEEDHKQHPICRILVKAGATEITDANITNLVGTSECPFVIGVLKVLKADELLSQWASDYSQWKAANGNDFNEWLSDLRGSIDPESDIAAQIITELNDIKMRHKDVTIAPSDWESCDETFNGLTYHAKKNIPVIGITENDTACWLEITSGAALYQEALVSGLGSFTIYSEEAEEVDMHFRIWFIGKAESGDPTPTQLDKITTKLDELANKVGKGSRDISKVDYEALSEEDKMNGTDYYVYDDDEGEEGMQTASTIIYEDPDGSKRSVQNELDGINVRLTQGLGKYSSGGPNLYLEFGEMSRNRTFANANLRIICKVVLPANNIYELGTVYPRPKYRVPLVIICSNGTTHIGEIATNGNIYITPSSVTPANGSFSLNVNYLANEEDTTLYSI